MMLLASTCDTMPLSWSRIERIILFHINIKVKLQINSDLAWSVLLSTTDIHHHSGQNLLQTHLAAPTIF